MKKYDIAAYVWPAYTGKDLRSRIFWPDGYGEWQTVMSAPSRLVNKPKNYKWNHVPFWGCVDEADPEVMEMEINEATKYGVNVFIYDWYWYDKHPFLENCLNDGFLKAKNKNKMKFYLMWANHDVSYCWDTRNSDIDVPYNSHIWYGDVDREEFEKIAHHIIEKYFKQENYYKIDGKPVFMIYDVNKLIKGLGGIEHTQNALKWFRNEVQRAGLPGVELQIAGWCERVSLVTGVDSERVYSTKEVADCLKFDSVTNYQFVHLFDMNRDYSECLKSAKSEWERMSREYKIPYYPHISIGWDKNPRYRNYQDIVCKNTSPQLFEKGLKMAKEYVDKNKDLHAPLITINSWNEWTETSYLEPDLENGYAYLEAIKHVFIDEK